MKRIPPYVIVVLILAIAIGTLIGYRTTHHGDTAQTQPGTSVTSASLDARGMDVGTGPWPNEQTRLKARLAADQLPALSEEGTALHIHQHLDLIIHGKSVAVPAEVGIGPNNSFIAPIHIHDTTGVVHVESPVIQDFTLGQVFDVWGVHFDGSCIGGYCADTTNALTVYVNGVQYTGDPRALVLKAHQEIVVVYGTKAEVPTTIPTSFAFAAGL